MTTQLKLSKQEFEREYFDRYLAHELKNVLFEHWRPKIKERLDEEMKKVMFFHDLINDKYDPNERKIALRITCKTNLSRNFKTFERILKTLGGNIEEKLDVADTLVYRGGANFCDYKFNRADSPIVLSPILWQIENKGKTGLIFYTGTPSENGCTISKCPETKILHELEVQKKDIIRFQLGYPQYRDSLKNITTFE